MNCLCVFQFSIFYFIRAGKVKSAFLLFSNKTCFTFTQKHTFRASQCNHRLQLIIWQLYWSSWGFGGVFTIELFFTVRKLFSRTRKVIQTTECFCVSLHIKDAPFQFQIENMEESTETFQILFSSSVYFIVSIVEVCSLSNETSLHRMPALKGEQITENSCSQKGFLFSKCGALRDACKLQHSMNTFTKSLWHEMLCCRSHHL